MAVISPKLTYDDLLETPDDGKRYEIIDGVLYVAKQPNWYHQLTCDNAVQLLREWNRKTGLGNVVSAPGIIFSDVDDVAPDVVWVSNERFVEGIDAAGHLCVPPELIV
jgi:Uma2 family endonuclease